MCVVYVYLFKKCDNKQSLAESKKTERRWVEGYVRNKVFTKNIKYKGFYIVMTVFSFGG